MSGQRTAAKTKQIVGRRPIGEASVVETYVSETIGREPRYAQVCSGR
jgi:hypothetical protein